MSVLYRKSIFLGVLVVVLLLLFVGCTQFMGDENGVTATRPPSGGRPILIEAPRYIFRGERVTLKCSFLNTVQDVAPKVDWKILSGTATITSSGELRTSQEGEVVVRALAKDGAFALARIVVYDVTLTAEYTGVFQEESLLVKAEISPYFVGSDRISFDWNIENGSGKAVGFDLGNLTFEVEGKDAGDVVVYAQTQGRDRASLSLDIVAPLRLIYDIHGDDLDLALPLYSGDRYNLKVRWDSGFSPLRVTDAEQGKYTYMRGGRKVVEIWSDTLDGLTFGIDHGRFSYNFDVTRKNALKLVGVEQFGGVRFINNAGTFAMCKNLSEFTATDTPYIEGDISSMFELASSFNDDISDWDVSNVTDMRAVFYQAGAYNNGGVPLDWGDKTSKVTTMAGMFRDATAFNQDISSWNTESVIDMLVMFERASNFNQPLNRWNVEKVYNMSGMFSDATNFNQPLNQWNPERVTNMSGMFSYATTFNQNLSDWEFPNLQDMSGCFYGARNFSQNMSSWENWRKKSGVKYGGFLMESGIDTAINEGADGASLLPPGFANVQGE